MSKKHKREKIRREAPKGEAWVEPWCRDHVAELAKHRGMIVTLSEGFGIVGVAHDIIDAVVQAQHLKRSVAQGCVHVNVDTMLVKIGVPWATAPKRNPDEPTDPLRPTRKADDFGKVWTHPLPKPEDPPRPVPQLDTARVVPELNIPPPPLSDPFDNAGMVLDVSNPTSEIGLDTVSLLPHASGSAFPSPHPQPPFMPRQRSTYDRGVLLDGNGHTPRRGLRFD